MKFKVGQRVRYLGNAVHLRENTHVITEVCDLGRGLVQINGLSHWYYMSEFVSIEEEE